jgi:Tfp pilus assembly protein PilF
MKSNNIVSVWEENVVIPTYGIGKPEKNPIFLENRVYQGSSGVVYPYPVIEKILDDKNDKTYHAVFLENQYLKIMILPELGGRVQMAYDKIKQRHFIYYNQVIKPALVGLTGPWISGGIEFNWPQHHRPTTFDPIDFTIEHHDDGSKTVWVSEVERMFRTKGMAGFRLYPDKAYLEINAKLYNRTPFPQTFLWWANPAVKVNDDYQSVFPPDVHAVFDHGKRDVSEFPIAKGTYYKVDYSAGVDISRYKNIPVPTSYMAVKSKYDFMGGYEHDTKGGLLHVADHHVSPGKKQWTWGNGEFGYAWDRNLTDEDGPYIELMTGVFTDNQPDFSWIQPFEERTFTQYFMPYSELGVVKNATKDALVNLEIEENTIQLKLYTTAQYENTKATVEYRGRIIYDDVLTLSPALPFSTSIRLKEKVVAEDIVFKLKTAEGKLLVSYHPEKQGEKPVPNAANPAKDPKSITSIEQLFLTGLHIEQYRHATYKATDYYEEALRREPGDVRNNNAMGLWYLRRGKFNKAEKYFERAIQTLTQRNPNPYDGEPYFNLGICLFYQERYDESFEAFFKSAWNAAHQDGAYLNLARIATRKGQYEQALDLVDKSLLKNYHSHTARHLKTAILRKLNLRKRLYSSTSLTMVVCMKFTCC